MIAKATHRRSAALQSDSLTRDGDWGNAKTVLTKINAKGLAHPTGVRHPSLANSLATLTKMWVCIDTPIVFSRIPNANAVVAKPVITAGVLRAANSGYPAIGQQNQHHQ